MGKKPRNKQAPSKNKRKLALPGLALGILVVLTSVYFATKPAENAQPVAPATGFLVETRPVMSSALFTGKVARAYRIAREIPKILDSQFCYCY